MRKILKQARKSKNMTQQQVVDYLGITLDYYKKIESGVRDGNFALWDDLEDLFLIHQRKLREISENRRDQEDSR